MKTLLLRVSVSIVLATPLAAVFAQAQTPTREGNTWDWRDHQPTEAQVEHREKSARVAPTAAERDNTAAIENRLNRDLLNGSSGTAGRDSAVGESSGVDPNSPRR